MPSIHDHTQKKLQDQTAASIDILWHAKSKLSTSNSFRDIKIQKTIQSDRFRAFSVTTQELDFLQPCGFYRYSKVVYHLKPKNYIDGPNLFSKSVLPIFFRALRACLTKLKENYIIKL